MMKRLLTILVLCVVGAFAAAPQVFISGSAEFERDRIMRLEHSLNFTKEPMVSTWYITIDPGNIFDENVQKLHLDTESGYTYLGSNQTHLNEDYLIWHDDHDVRHLLAHEAGHLICECTSEQKANDIAYQLEK